MGDRQELMRQHRFAKHISFHHRMIYITRKRLENLRSSRKFLTEHINYLDTAYREELNHNTAVLSFRNNLLWEVHFTNDAIFRTEDYLRQLEQQVNFMPLG